MMPSTMPISTSTMMISIRLKPRWRLA